MENTQDTSHEKEQPTTPSNDYRALIQITRPLMIVKDAPAAPRLPICRDQAIWAHELSFDPESALKRGEIVPTETPEPATASDTAGTAPESAEEGAADSISDLTLRIYLGMS